jgi:RNA polymerase sigma-70 factor (ECF subfamily)
VAGDEPASTSAAAASRAAERAARESYGRLVALLARRTGDLADAEDALAEAFASALRDWPRNGAPDRPEAWLMAAAKRKAIDAGRKRATAREAEPRVALMTEELEAVNRSNGAADDIPDERLALMFACAHPAIEPSVRAPLILQTVLGLDAGAVASAFLVSPAAMGQRLVRAKVKIKEAGVPFAIPARDDLAPRLEAVLDAVYAAFAEGWTDPQGSDTRRRNLAEEAIWLGRVIAQLMPDEPEALGLLALMLHADARRGARRDADGEFVPLAEQDAALWDTALIDEAEALIRRASRLARTGRYQLEAAVQSAHAVRRLTGVADWAAIVALYDALWAVTGSPVVALNRAVAIAEIEGPGAALRRLDDLDAEIFGQYQPYWAARAALLARAGWPEDAAEAYERAIGLESDDAVRRWLQRKREALAH